MMNFINVDEIIYAKLTALDGVLILFAHNHATQKTVIVTNRTKDELMGDTNNPNVFYCNKDLSKIRGYRAHNIYVLSDVEISEEEIQEILSGQLSVSDSPTGKIKTTFIWNTKS